MLENDIRRPTLSRRLDNIPTLYKEKPAIRPATVIYELEFAAIPGAFWNTIP
jgi:hypothetical protein